MRGSMYDNAPIGNTCPLIDSIINRMEQSKSEAEYIRRDTDNYNDEVSVISYELDSAISEMEDIRDANSELREWGNEEYERAEYEKDERDNLIKKIEDLREELDNLRAEKEDLEEAV